MSNLSIQPVRELYSMTDNNKTFNIKLTDAKTVTINLIDTNTDTNHLENTMVIRAKAKEPIESFEEYSQSLINKHKELILSIASQRKKIKKFKNTNNDSLEYEKLKKDLQRDAHSLRILM